MINNYELHIAVSIDSKYKTYFFICHSYQEYLNDFACVCVCVHICMYVHVCMDDIGLRVFMEWVLLM